MKKIINMSAVEVLEEIGVGIYENDIGIFIKDKEKCKKLSDIIKADRGENTFQILMNFFSENDEYIDKEKFVLITLHRLAYEKSLNKFDKHIGMIIDEKINKGKKLLHNSKTVIGMSSIKGDILKIITADNLTGEITNNKNKKRLEQIDKQVPLSNIIEPTYLYDISEFICTDPAIGRLLEEHIVYKALSYYGIDIKDKQKIQEFIENPDYSEKLDEECERTLTECSQYVSVDKLLLISIYRYLSYLDNHDCDEGICKYVQQLVNQIYKNVDEKKKIKGKVLVRKNFDHTVLEDEDEDVEEKEISLSAKDLKRRIDNNFINGQYYGDRKLDKIKKEIFEDNMPIEIYDPRVINLLGIKKEQLKELSNDDNNFRYLLKHQIIDDKLLREILLKRQYISSDMIKYLLKNENITKQDVLDLYNNGIITLSNLSDLREDEDLHIEDIAQESEMVKLYKLYTKREEKEEEFNKYIQLYKQLKLKDRDIDTRKENANKLIEELGIDFEEEDLKKMYGLDIIPIETAIEWGGESITQEMFNQGILKPIDAKRLYKNNTLSIDIIKQVLKSSNLSDEDKLTLICSTFDSDEDLETRMELIQYLNVDDTEKRRNLEKNKKNKKTIPDDDSISKNTYITDPCMRWRLISLLDQDYSQKASRDGFVIFKLPNIKDGTIVIEKMFKRHRSGLEASYGNATYILSEENFLRYKNDLINDNSKITINLDGLTRLREEEKADRLNHSSRWGENIKEYFDVEKQESRYTQETIDEINRVIKSIENSRTLK